MGIIIIISLLIVLFYSIAKIITGNSKKIHVGNLDAEISKDGKIAGNYNVLINGYELNIPINTSINEIEEHNRKANELENVTLSKYNSSLINSIKK
ncbi:MAG: hypothetical protein Q4F97_12835 [Bacteroidales bacterium]|nr:hypothetical protein [Bacteroidales bacterium]